MNTNRAIITLPQFPSQVVLQSGPVLRSGAEQCTIIIIAVPPKVDTERGKGERAFAWSSSTPVFVPMCRAGPTLRLWARTAPVTGGGGGSERTVLCPRIVAVTHGICVAFAPFGCRLGASWDLQTRMQEAGIVTMAIRDNCWRTRFCVATNC
jgi:hypothetical protein